jgi:pimeloyl-ACP methyl ester carboxylesterase
VVLANGIDFDVTERGTGAPAIVFLHGLACDATAWSPQLEDLGRDHRCLAINFRGRGKTPPVAPFDVEQQAADVAAILDAAGIRGAVVVGHSLGGIAALVLNGSRPELVIGTVLGDSPVRPEGLDGRELAARIRAAGSTGPLAAVVESFWAETTPEHVREQVRTMMLSCPPEVAAGMLDVAIPPERMLQLVRAADRKPFMAIWPERPSLGNPAWLREQTMFLRQEPVADAGHFFQLERAEHTNALLRAFLEEAERDPRIS